MREILICSAAPFFAFIGSLEANIIYVMRMSLVSYKNNNLWLWFGGVATKVEKPPIPPKKYEKPGIIVNIAMSDYTAILYFR